MIEPNKTQHLGVMLSVAFGILLILLLALCTTLTLVCVHLLLLLFQSVS